MIVKQYCSRAPWDMAGIEGWLNEMAAQGYVLDRWSDFLGRTTFHTDPAAGEYRYLPGPHREVAPGGRAAGADRLL